MELTVINILSLLAGLIADGYGTEYQGGGNGEAEAQGRGRCLVSWPLTLVNRPAYLPKKVLVHYKDNYAKVFNMFTGQQYYRL